MHTQDDRFIHSVLADRGRHIAPLVFIPGGHPWTPLAVREWSHAPQAGTRSAGASVPGTSPGTVLIIVACWGGTLPAVELSVGMSLVLPDVDVERVHHRANPDQLTGQVFTPETAPAHRGTVQVAIAEHLADGAESFGVVKLRSRVLHAAHGLHVLRFIAEMPSGWPENGIVERPEAAFTERTAPVPPDSLIEFAIPILTPRLMRTETFNIVGLADVVRALRAVAAG